MKFETLILSTLFVSCVALCALILGAMVRTTPASVRLTDSHHVHSILLAAPSTCTLPADGIICPRVAG
jgi:hypothetical protein